MELTFNFIDLARLVEEKPAHVVTWAAFGLPLVILVISLFLSLLTKLKIRKAFKEDTLILVSSLIAILWLLGFITQMIFLFTEVSGLRMLIIWIVMAICYSAFVLFNSNMIIKWANNISKPSK